MTVHDPDTPAVNKLPLPPLPEDFPREETAKEIADVMYGGLPPEPVEIHIEKCCEARVARWPGAPKLWTYKLHCRGGEVPFSFTVQILFPQGDGPFPAVMNGDGCWWYATEEVAQMVIAQGCALVMFDRTEMARDLGGQTHGNPDWKRREGGLYDVYPGGTFGAISAWAWGIHRCVDLLMSLPFIDPEKIAVTGHSRGGKTALLAGLTDQRITMINDNASGTCGAALSRYVSEQGETLAQILFQFPHWFGPKLQAYADQEEDLPFDQHSLLACLAPRPLLMTYSLEDMWANQRGMVLAAEAAREFYQFYGKADAVAYHFREGGHAHLSEDWAVLLDYIGVHWQGKAPGCAYNQHPYGSII
ncbi:hypothetical protein P0Y35_13645 [Kiritimatiellaeota bacterium B1221]|nr:hypothetical protein [Kiritimatiellaeota bacterium B1221]